MFQTVGHTAIEAIATCMGLPLVRRATGGKTQSTAMDYNHQAANAGCATADEIADLATLLSACKQRFPSVRGVSCGAILSNYQRLRVEAVCGALGLTPLAFLWQRDQRRLLQDMVSRLALRWHTVVVLVCALQIDAQMDAVLVKVN
jgi:diphthine-ammonia ligase